jgi:carotenoid cleavage dioxygenase-like enzyme
MAALKNMSQLGFKNLEKEVMLDDLYVQGKIPEWLSGSLIRNGPAKFDLEKQSLNHWFDGLAMLHKFSFNVGKVSYTNKFIKSNAFIKTKEKGKISFREFATDPCRSIFSRVSSVFSFDTTDNTNVNISKIDNKFIAMTETPIPIEYDPETLDTIGVLRYDDKLLGSLTTAHPHYDQNTNESFNYLTQFSRNSKYNVYRITSGKTRNLIASIEAKAPSYMHSFGLTEHYIILVEFPLVVNSLDLLLSGRPFIENFKWRPEQGTKFTLINRLSGKVVGIYFGEPFFAFHHINAFEVDNKIVIDIITYKDNSIINSLYLDILRGKEPMDIPVSEYRRFTIDRDNGSVGYKIIHEGLELPRINYQFNTMNYQYLYAVGVSSVTSFTNRLVKIDVQTGDSFSWIEQNCQPGEPVFVPRPGAKEEDDGVVMSIVLDSNSGKSFLLILDSRTFKEIARALVPHHIPFGIHGQYYGET